MSFEDAIRQIIQEENEKHLSNIKKLLETHGYKKTPKTLSVKEASEILGFGTSKVYDLIHRAEYTNFPFLRDGTKIRVPYNGLLRWIDYQSKQVI